MRFDLEGRQVAPFPFRPVADQRIGDLNQQAGAIAHQRIGANGPAVIQIDQDFEALADDLVRLSPLHVGNEANAARIVLVRRVIKALPLGHYRRHSRLLIRWARFSHPLTDRCRISKR